MSNYTTLREIFGQPWYISAPALNQFWPVAKNFIDKNNSGFVWEQEKEPENMRQSFLSAESFEESTEPEREVEIIHVLPVRDIIMKHDMVCGPPGTRTLANRLLQADENPDVISHILVIESGGGSAAAVPELTEAMEKCTKPIIAWVDGIMASAAMYIGSYADNIIASRDTDLIGSIGTMIIFGGRKAVSDENADKEIEVRVYADKSTEKNNWYEEAINNFNFQPVKDKLLNPSNEKFHADIRANLPNVEDKHLTGAIFEAKDVIGVLVNEIGPFETAVEKAKELGQTNKSNTNSNQSTINETKQPFTMKQLQPLAKAAGLSDLEVHEGGVFMPLENALTASEAIGAKNSGEEQNAALQKNLDTATITLQERDNRISELEKENAELRGRTPEKKETPAAKNSETPVEDGPVVSETDDQATAMAKVKQEYQL